jgi:hypothetical protein
MKYINQTLNKKATQKIKKIEKLMWKNKEKSYKVDFFDEVDRAWVIKRNGLIFCFLENSIHVSKENKIKVAWVMDREKKRLSVIRIDDPFQIDQERIYIKEISGRGRGVVTLKNDSFFLLNCGYFIYPKEFKYQPIKVFHKEFSNFARRLDYNLYELESQFKEPWF